MHLDIINYYRKDNPLFDIKVIDKNEMSLGVHLNIKKSALIYLMSEYHYSYDIAETYLKYVALIEDDSTFKFAQLLKIKQDLLTKGYLYPNEALKLLFLNKEATVIGYSQEDKQLLHLAESLNLKLEFFDFNRNVKALEAYQFVRFEDEVNYVLNEVAYLLDNGVDIKDVVIIRRNKEYDYYLERFAPTYGYQINIENSTTWFETGVYVEFAKLYDELKDVNLALEELKKVCLEDDLYDEFVKIVNHLIIEDVSFEVQKSYLIHSLKNESISKAHYYPAIKVASNISLYSNKHVFILGFTQGDFPKTSKDDGYLSNKELKSLHLLNAKEETKFDQENLVNFFKQPNLVILTYSLKTLQEKRCYASPIISELNIKPIVNPFKDYFYSSKSLSYTLADLNDLSKYYHEKGDKYYQLKDLISISYDTYSNQFNGVTVYNSSSPLTLSCSQLDLYYSCPFKYYLSRIIEVDPFEESEAIILGKITHSLLENGLLNPDYDIATHFIELVKQSDISDELKILWQFSLKDQIVEMVNSLRKHPRYMKNPEFEFEVELDAKLDELTSVTGRIDKLVVLDKKYVAAVDYKTGSSGDFKPDYLVYGKSSQLPTYAYLIQEDARYSDYVVSGLYINHIIKNDNDMTIKKDRLIQDHLRLSGKSLTDIDAISSFDSTVADGKSEFIKGISVNKAGELMINSKSTALATSNEFAEYIKKVKSKYLEAASSIRNNEFNIYPFVDGRNSACSSCSYRDICYVRSNQMHFTNKMEENSDE